jgi:hypothetical protein
MMRTATAAVAFIVMLSGTPPIFGGTARAGDPTTLDCLTANESSLTLRNHYELRASRAQLLVCSAASCPADVRNECIRRVGEINQAMPTIVFEAKDASGRDLIAVTVKMDGELLAQRLEGTALSLDPGEHTFTFEVSGQARLETRLLILEGEKDRRERVVFETIGKPAPPISPRIDVHQPAGSGRPRLGTLKIVGVGLGGVGLAAIGVGTAYGLVAISRRNSASAVCPAACADPSGVALWNRARSAGEGATVAFIVGAAGVAAGVTMWLVAKPESPEAPAARLSLGPGVVQLSGRW